MSEQPKQRTTPGPLPFPVLLSPAVYWRRLPFLDSIKIQSWQHPRVHSGNIWNVYCLLLSKQFSRSELIVFMIDMKVFICPSAYLVAKDFYPPVNSVSDVLKSNRPYMSNPGIYWDMIQEDYPALHQYALDTSEHGHGGFDMDVLKNKILDKQYIYGPFGKIESYGRIEEYIRSNNGSNPFYIGKEIIYFFSQGYAIRKDYNYEKQVNVLVGRLRDMGLFQKFMMDSLDSR